MMHYILTGAPGAGKTVILRQLERDGFDIVEEAATDVITLMQGKGVAEPWRDPAFPDSVADLQVQRLQRARRLPNDIQFHDRSPICTVALAIFLGFEISTALRARIEQIDADGVYERDVFFVQLMGDVARTEARRIGLEDARRFEKVHEDAYRAHGFRLIFVPPGDVSARVATVKRTALVNVAARPHI